MIDLQGGDLRITADEDANGSALRHHVELRFGIGWKRVKTTDTLSSAVYIARQLHAPTLKTTDTLSSAVYIAKQLQTPARTITVGYFLRSGRYDANGKKEED